MYGNPVPSHTGTGSHVYFSDFYKFSKGQPGSVTYRNRFPRIKKPFSAFLTAFIHSHSNSNIPIRTPTMGTLKHIIFHHLFHQSTYFHHPFPSTDTLIIFYTYSDTIRLNLTPTDTLRDTFMEP